MRLFPSWFYFLLSFLSTGSWPLVVRLQIGRDDLRWHSVEPSPYPLAYSIRHNSRFIWQLALVQSLLSLEWIHHLLGDFFGRKGTQRYKCSLFHSVIQLQGMWHFYHATTTFYGDQMSKDLSIKQLKNNQRVWPVVVLVCKWLTPSMWWMLIWFTLIRLKKHISSVYHW